MCDTDELIYKFLEIKKVENKDKMYTPREISRGINIHYDTVTRSLVKLDRYKLVTKKVNGRRYKFKIN